MVKSDSRLPSETFTIRVTGGELPDGTLVKHTLEVTLSYYKGKVYDVIFVGRGKTGHGIDLMFTDLGIQLSRAMQGRDTVDETAELEGLN